MTLQRILKHYPLMQSRFSASRLFLVLSLFLGLVCGLDAATTTLAGFDTGLYRIVGTGTALPLWSGGEIRKIIRASDAWYFLSSAGIMRSVDLVSFELRSTGLPQKIIKHYDGKLKTFTRESCELKDLEIDPLVPSLMVTCTKDAVYVSDNGGNSWTSYGSPEPGTGLKAVCVVSSPEAMIFASHPVRGVFSRPLNLAKGAWARVPGIEIQASTANPDESSDIIACSTPTGIAVWASTTFLPRLYRYDFSRRAFVEAWRGKEDIACVDSLQYRSDGILYATDGEIRRYDPRSGLSGSENAATSPIRTVIETSSGRQGRLNAYWSDTNPAAPLALSELWLMERTGPYAKSALGKFGIYIRTDLALKPASWKTFGEIVSTRGLNMVVLDVKDDLGRLRFEPRDSALKALTRVSQVIDIDAFAAEMKSRGVWLVARIVVFKDQVMYERKSGAYAVWNTKEKKPWQGYMVAKPKPENPEAAPEAPGNASPTANGIPAAAGTPPAVPAEGRKDVQEFWVDPYCEEIWAYNAAIANEALARGFDEIQFDYIRFPTDGANIGDAFYRWQDPGMDKEGALMSFLKYARERIKAPIGIDVYGANGWYRSGARTGQDIELLSRYVDVVCPMYYPSHFEQSFLAFEPAVERPYRIYRFGTKRAEYITRRRVVVRPYVQSFLLNVSYDKTWYNADYVAREAAGVRDSGNPGLTYWNNVGNYENIPKP